MNCCLNSFFLAAHSVSLMNERFDQSNAKYALPNLLQILCQTFFHHPFFFLFDIKKEAMINYRTDKIFSI